MIEPNAFILGDCMQYLKEYPDKYFDLAVVDPVYGDVRQGGYMRGQGGENAARRGIYHLELWKQPKTERDYFDELFRVSKNQIIWGGNYFAPFLPASQCWLCWDKKHPEGVSFADVEFAWTSFDQASRIFRFLWSGMLQENMKDKEHRIHPTQKPVALYKWILDRFAKPGSIILDTHVGSGSSIIAFADRGFKYVGFEIDPDYYEKAQKRIFDETRQISIFEYMNGEGQ